MFKIIRSDNLNWTYVCFGAALAVWGLGRFDETLPVLSYIWHPILLTSLLLPIWMMSLMLCNDGNWKEIDIDENHILENIWFNNDLKAPSGIIRFALIVRWLLLVLGQRHTVATHCQQYLIFWREIWIQENSYYFNNCSIVTLLQGLNHFFHLEKEQFYPTCVKMKTSKWTFSSKPWDLEREL